jgi:hypothetical protein
MAVDLVQANKPATGQNIIHKQRRAKTIHALDH